MEYTKKTQIMSNKIFTTVPVPKFPRNTFNLSRPVLFAPRMHKEYPTEILEIIPGDGIKIHTEAYAKSQPMVAPTFAKMDTAQESFFVPCWQLSELFDDFITGGERGTFQDKMPFITVGFFYSVLLGCITPNFGSTSADEYNERLTQFQDILDTLDIMRSIPVVVPDFILETEDDWLGDRTIASGNSTRFEELNEHLADSVLRINLLPFAAVLKIWCEFYRDENLCEDLFDLYWKGNNDFPYHFDLSKAVGNVNTLFASFIAGLSYPDMFEYLHSLFGLKSRAWKKDYFTSALPFVQKGPDVLLPIGGNVTLHGDLAGVSQEFTWSGSATGTGKFYTEDAGGNLHEITGSIDSGPLGPSIQDLRTAIKLEELYEADGRFGNRYPENTLGQFGVRTPDSRLPRCQFLGSNSQPVQIQQVVQNSGTGIGEAAGTTTAQGNLAGLASSYGSNRLAKTYQTQHGFVVCLTAIRVHSLYEQGIHPMFSRYDRTEYAWPRFAQLGEQPIYTKQLFVDGTVSEDEVFGYTPRYADYKSDNGSIHGPLKGSLNFWTMARRFANKPVLNEEFIYGRPRQDAFIYTNHLQPVFIMELDYHVKANRVLPFYGTPSL